MQKIQIMIDGKHVCYIAAKSRREALERVKASKAQKVGITWDLIKNLAPNLPVSAIDCGRI